jgi:pimeloyl-ACP methyl ester carboxylesterase
MIRAVIGCASGESDAAIDASLRAPVPTDEVPSSTRPPAPKPIGDLILPQLEPTSPKSPSPPQPAISETAPEIARTPINPQKPPPAAPAPIVATAQPKPEDATFSRADLLYGKSIDEPTCTAMTFAVWVTSVGAPECIRYYYSDAGGTSPRALLFLNGDFTYRGVDGQPTVDPDYTRLGPADLQRIAEVRSRDYGGPMIYLARPGTLGSSGYELLVRHSPREVALVAAAVSEIKRRHGILTFDLVGHSGGGLLVGALVSQRSDIGCAVTSSGVLATNAWTSQRLNLPQTNSGFLYDPLEHVSEIRPGPGFRYILLTDAADTTVSASSTQLYLDALAAAGVPHTHIELTAADDAHHDLALHGFRAAIGCAHDMTDAEITALLTHTIVTNRRMSELSPLGDMPEQTAGDKGSPTPYIMPKTH